MLGKRCQYLATIFLAVLVFFALSCAGCTSPNEGKEAFDRQDRFTFVPSEAWASFIVITDNETGVQYLYASRGYGGGLTVLVDETGKPLVKK